MRKIHHDAFAAAQAPAAPPLPEREDGALRRVGVEIEFAELDLKSAAKAVMQAFGGVYAGGARYQKRVSGTPYGDFLIELDSRHVQPEEPGLSHFAGLLSEDLADKTAATLGYLSQDLVPNEITTPPLPWPALGKIDALARILRQRGAKGTGASSLYAFALQLNPEVARRDAAYIRRHIQAYLLLSDRLRAEIAVDPARRLTAFAAGFPQSYKMQVLDPDYAPGQDRLIDDYLRENPTRNRELDMLPLFACLDPGRVKAKVADSRIKPRPAFHYRLPNSRVDDIGWSVTQEWRRWLYVEELACDAALLRRLCRRYRDRDGAPFWRRVAGKMEALWRR